MQDKNIKIIGGRSENVEVTIKDDFQVIKTDEAKEMVDENLRIISELEGK